MRSVLLIILLTLTGCARDSSRCESPADCFVGEQCVGGVCTTPPVVVTGSPASSSMVAQLDHGRLYRLVLDDEDEPHIFVMTDQDSVEHWWWDGFSWASATIATNLVLDEISALEAAYDDETGFRIVIATRDDVLSIESADGRGFDVRQIRDEPAFGVALDAAAGLTAICAFDGDLGDFENLTPFVMLRDRSGEWREFGFDEPASPYCNAALSDSGVVTVALARYSVDTGEELYLAQSIAAPLDAVDLTLTRTQRLGRLPSSSSLAVTSGAPVLMHTVRGVSSETIFMTLLHDLDRHTTRSVTSVPATRLINASNLIIDPLEPRRMLFTTIDYTLSAADPVHHVGERIGDFITLRRVEEFDLYEGSVHMKFGSDGVVRVATWGEDAGLLYRVGL